MIRVGGVCRLAVRGFETGRLRENQSSIEDLPGLLHASVLTSSARLSMYIEHLADLLNRCLTRRFSDLMQYQPV